MPRFANAEVWSNAKIYGNAKKGRIIMKKFELIPEKTLNWFGKTLFRIKACMDFTTRSGAKIHAGDIGGYVEKESNLSHDGKAWVWGDAKVWGNAQVYDDAEVYGNALVYGNADIYGNAEVYGNAKIYGNAEICGNAQVYGNAKICD